MRGLAGMHEHATCRALLARALELCDRHGAVAIRSLRIEVGALTGHDPEHLAVDFAAIAAGTLADGARLEVVRIPLRIHCPACGRDSDVGAERIACPACHHEHTQLIDGDELRLVDVGLATGGPAR